MNSRSLFVVSPTEVDRMFACIRGRSSIAIRSRALLLTLQRSGIRTREVTRLRVGDVDLAEETIRVTGSKRNRSRLVGLEAELGAAMAAWIDRRTALGLGPGQLFCSLNANAMTPDAVRAWLRRLARKAGIPHRVVPYSLRHGFACHLVRSGARVDEVQAALGHSSLRTTFIYLQSLGATSALDAVRRVAW